LLPTQRLSPKNQVTIPREARALLQAGSVDHLRAMKHAMPKIGDTKGEIFPLLLLLTEKELQRREQRIIDDATLSPVQRLHLVTALNGEMAMMAIDAQHRVVLPAHLVAYLQLDRDVFFICTNSTIQLWNPEHYQRWSGRAAGPNYNPDLNAYLMI
jgi:DNA-binding transcriptional regulator/RsmH inhibitor MraZ